MQSIIRMFLFIICLLLPDYGFAFEIKDILTYQSMAIKEFQMTDSMHTQNKDKNRQITGTKTLENLLGNKRADYQTQYVYIGKKLLQKHGIIKWYYYYQPSWNGRGRGKLNYENNNVMQSGRAGDTLVIAKKNEAEILLLIVQKDSAAEKELYETLGLTGQKKSPPVKSKQSWFGRLWDGDEQSAQITDASVPTPSAKTTKVDYDIKSAALPIDTIPSKNWIRIYFTPGMDCENNIIAGIKSAKKIDIAVYSITNKNIYDALVAAKARGVKIRIVTDRLQAKGRGSLVDELQAAGFDIRTNIKHKIEHNKFAIFNGREITTGSYNWTAVASKSNSENCLFFDQPAKEYSNRFEYLWNFYQK